jgi:RNA polymerase sigma-70 factor (ECF subfamily)
VNFEDEEHLSNSNPDQDYEANQRRQLTQRLIKALPEREQEVIRLKFEENLSYQQISSITGLTVTHVGVLIHNTLLKLKDEYKKIEKSKEAL